MQKTTTVAEHKRKASEMRTMEEVSKRARPIMSNSNISVDLRHPADCPFMMAFLNIAEHNSVMTSAEESRLTA
ncbi:unnamed protein product, partial [Ascophyllum nodosum]